MNRFEGHQFQQGRSGNPGGRPKLPHELKKALPDACAGLIALCNDPDASIRLRAVERVISWNIGAPGVAIPEDEMAPIDRRELLAAALEVIRTEAPDLLEVPRPEAGHER